MLGISRKKLKLLNVLYIYFVDTFTFTSLNIYLFTLYFNLFLSIWLVNQPSFFIGRSTALICSEIKKKKNNTINHKRTRVI